MGSSDLSYIFTDQCIELIFSTENFGVRGLTSYSRTRLGSRAISLSPSHHPWGRFFRPARSSKALEAALPVRHVGEDEEARLAGKLGVEKSIKLWSAALGKPRNGASGSQLTGSQLMRSDRFQPLWGRRCYGDGTLVSFSFYWIRAPSGWSFLTWENCPLWVPERSSFQIDFASLFFFFSPSILHFISVVVLWILIVGINFWFDLNFREGWNIIQDEDTRVSYKN